MKHPTWHTIHLPTDERRRRRIRQLIGFVAFAVLGLGAGLGAGRPFADRPVGQASVLVRPLPGNAFADQSGDTLVDLKTEAQLAFSDKVLAKVQEAVGGINAATLRRRVSVRVANNAEVVVISYRGDTSLSATNMAKRVANAYLEVRTQNAVIAAHNRTAIVEASLAKTQHDFDAALAAQPDVDTSAVAVLGKRIGALRGNLRAVSGEPSSPGTVLSASAPRSAQVRKLRVTLLLTGVIVAGAIGVWYGSRPRHLPRWVKRFRGRRGSRAGAPAW